MRLAQGQGQVSSARTKRRCRGWSLFENGRAHRLASELRNFSFTEADTREAALDPRAQSYFILDVFAFHRIAQDVAYFFFHTMTVTLRAPLQASLHALFQISDGQLCHRPR